MASTNWDTDRRRRKPPAWDPPKLLLVVGGLHVVASIGGGIWLQGSTIWLHQPERKRKWEKGDQSNREYSSKVLASKDVHHICNIIKGRLYMWTGLQKCQNKRGIANPVEDYASGSLRLTACRRG